MKATMTMLELLDSEEDIYCEPTEEGYVTVFRLMGKLYTAGYKNTTYQFHSSDNLEIAHIKRSNGNYQVYALTDQQRTDLVTARLLEQIR